MDMAVVSRWRLLACVRSGAGGLEGVAVAERQADLPDRLLEPAESEGHGRFCDVQNSDHK
jgi:hypothetical protein